MSQSVRRYVLTISVAAITAVGAIYGAGLKTQQEHKKERTKRTETSPEEQIAQLQAARDVVAARRFELQRKLAQVEARRARTEADVVTAGGEAGEAGKRGR